MFKNYLKTALRNLWRFRGYTFINIFGLAIGMACVILIMLYVQSETSYDSFHSNSDQIYRLNLQVTNPQTGEVRKRAIGPYRMAEELRNDFPDFGEIIRIAPQGRELVEYKEEQYQERALCFADPTLFQLFNFPLVKGDPQNVLDNPFSVVLSETQAEKYFGQEEPIGKILEFSGSEFEVTGIMEDVPENTQFQFDMVASMNCAKQVFSRIVLENWGEGFVETFVMVEPGKNPSDFEERLASFVEVKLAAWSQASPQINMQPLSSIYLHSSDISSYVRGGDITYVYAFSFIAIFILIIACINFMNLSTARASMRAKEVGLRKVTGATRPQLIRQFLGESTLLAVISFMLAISFSRLALPAFNQLANKELGIGALFDGPMFLLFIFITLFVGIAAGSYPALVLSAFEPISVLAGKLAKGFRGGNLRKVLVSFQFAISIFLLVVTAIVYKQLDYTKNIKLGYDKEHLVLLSAPGSFRAKFDQFQEKLLENPQIVNAGASSRVPPGGLSSSLKARPEGVPEDQQSGMQTVWTDFDFIETLGLELASGRSFSREFPADGREAFILNEAAVKSIGWTNEEAIGKTFGSEEITDWDEGQWVERDGRVIGVLKDFHFESLREKIVPTVYFVAPYMAWNYVVRLRGNDIPGSIQHIENTWEAFNPDIPFEYRFVDDNFSTLYATEERQGKIFATFAIIAIFVACLGLVGLASFTAERKKKEIGIRKVLGASASNLIILLSKEFTLLVFIAFCIAVPISWYLMQGWLDNFAYRTSINFLVYLGSGLTAIAIAWLAVGYQTARAAYGNPIHALKYE